MTAFKSQLDISRTIEMNSNGEKCNYKMNLHEIELQMSKDVHK
jgi:hypothetical protein